MNVPLPKSSFTPHPQGQHTGLIFDVEVRLNEATQWGPKHRVILKVESDTKMMDEDGNPILDDEGAHRGFVIWDWLTVARKEGSRFRDRREAILGRPLNEQELKATDFDPVSEFMGQRIGYVVKHRVKGDELYANIDTIWLENGRQDVDLSIDESLVSEIATLEKLVLEAGRITSDKIKPLRVKYGGSEDLENFTKETAKAYQQVLSLQIPDTTVDEDDLPF